MATVSSKKAYIKAQVRVLLFNKVLTKVSVKYSDYNNVFSMKNVVEVLENFGINKYAIE